VEGNEASKILVDVFHMLYVEVAALNWTKSVLLGPKGIGT
jgi:hypothetical protein